VGESMTFKGRTENCQTLEAKKEKPKKHIQ